MIKIGSTIFLELNDPDGDKKRYRSKVLDSEGDCLYIDYPVEEVSKKAHFLLEGTQCRAWFVGKDKAIYLFNTEVLGKLEREFPMLVLSDPKSENYIRIQRRQYVRIELPIDVAVQPLSNNVHPFTTVTIDISGGGMALLLPSNHTLKQDDEVNSWLPLHYQSGEITYINVTAKVVRIIPEKDNDKGSFQFVAIKEGDRQKIVRFCFEKQLAHRKVKTNNG
ncbi:flagellar brake protein [Evansella sp. AB-rgal1]|uniref:flagellar brake protein n=1 Tax=Evansella sp. AB-rgal1 TaxID=3242696 RepID=UPI00359F0C68